MQAARDVDAGLDRRDDRRDPVLRQHAAGIDGADDEGLRAGRARLRDVHVGQAGVGLAAGKPQLADAPFAPPVDDAVGGLGGERVGDVAEKEEIGLFDRHQCCARPALVAVERIGHTARFRRHLLARRRRVSSAGKPDAVMAATLEHHFEADRLFLFPGGGWVIEEARRLDQSDRRGVPGRCRRAAASSSSSTSRRSARSTPPAPSCSPSSSAQTVEGGGRVAWRGVDRRARAAP